MPSSVVRREELGQVKVEFYTTRSERERPLSYNATSLLRRSSEVIDYFTHYKIRLGLILARGQLGKPLVGDLEQFSHGWKQSRARVTTLGAVNSHDPKNKVANYLQWAGRESVRSTPLTIT